MNIAWSRRLYEILRGTRAISELFPEFQRSPTRQNSPRTFRKGIPNRIVDPLLWRTTEQFSHSEGLEFLAFLVRQVGGIDLQKPVQSIKGVRNIRYEPASCINYLRESEFTLLIMLFFRQNCVWFKLTAGELKPQSKCVLLS